MGKNTRGCAGLGGGEKKNRKRKKKEEMKGLACAERRLEKRAEKMDE